VKIDHGNGMGGPVGTSEVNAAARDALKLIDRAANYRCPVCRVPGLETWKHCWWPTCPDGRDQR